MIDENLGIALGLQSFVILLVAYCFDRAVEVGICCCIMGALTVLGLMLKAAK